MKIVPYSIVNIFVAAWISAIAIVAVQNAAPVSLNFLFFQSISIPVGVVLALSTSLGILVGAILQPLWNLPNATTNILQSETKKERRE